MPRVGIENHLADRCFVHEFSRWLPRVGISRITLPLHLVLCALQDAPTTWCRNSPCVHNALHLVNGLILLGFCPCSATCFQCQPAPQIPWWQGSAATRVQLACNEMLAEKSSLNV